MIKIPPAILLLATCLATYAAEIEPFPITTNARHQPPLEQERPVDAIVLWNSRDLAGWQMTFTNADVDISKTWFSTNGILTLHGKGNRSGYLKTENTFSNYQLHVEWRWSSTSASNANSGVLLHIGETNAIWPVCIEAQLKTSSAGELIGMGGVDFPAAFINNRKRAKITQSSENPMGEWNAYDIHCRSNTVEAFVNGTKKNFIEQVTVSSGHIGLQLEGHDIEFRNIWLKPL
jgi:hypothetical protein